MITIINNILSSNGYKHVDIELQSKNHSIYLFCPSDNNNREEYFVTVQFQKEDNEAAIRLLEENAQELFETISNSGKVERPFEKNCTMLLCHRKDMIERQTILALEEDQYNFKKNVITYTLKEIDALKAYLSLNGIEKIDNSIINGIINSENGNSFLEFKHSHKNEENHYSLILKAALKLPFVTYSPHEKQLTNLTIDIENSLSSEQLLLLRKLVNLDEEWVDGNIHQKVEQIWGDLL